MITLAASGPDVRAGGSSPDLELDHQVSGLHIEGTIVIDGEMNEPQWQQVEPATDFAEYRVWFGSDQSRMFSTELRAGTGEFWNGDRNSCQARLLFRPGY